MAEKRRDIDEVGTLEIVQTMFKEFGPQRAAELIGWAVVWGLTGVEDIKALRADLQARGLSRSSAFRAAADYRKLREIVESREDRRLSFGEIFRRLGGGESR